MTIYLSSARNVDYVFSPMQSNAHVRVIAKVFVQSGLLCSINSEKRSTNEKEDASANESSLSFFVIIGFVLILKNMLLRL